MAAEEASLQVDKVRVGEATEACRQMASTRMGLVAAVAIARAVGEEVQPRTRSPHW